MAASFVKAIHLHGDSILDNRSYVNSGNDEYSVAEHLTDLVVPPTKVTLLATDGYVTTDATVKAALTATLNEALTLALQ